MIEIESKRTYTSKTFDNEDGTNRLRAFGTLIHYKDVNDQFQDVDLRLQDQGTYWSVTKANQKLYINKQFDGADLIRFDNKLKQCNHTIFIKPHSLRWVNHTDFSDMVLFRNAQSVTGVLVDDYTIRYTDAFGDGLHIEISIRSRGLQKELIVDALNKLENPPTPDHKLVLFSRYTGAGLKVKANDLAYEWNGIDYYTSLAGFDIHELSHVERKTFVKVAKVIDADENMQIIRQFWALYNGALWQAKVLPTQFYLNATYPVRADATYESDAGGDGAVYYTSEISWVDGHDAASGEGLHSSFYMYLSLYYNPGATDWDFYRVFLPFDTSALPDVCTITAATVNIYISAITNGINDGKDYAAIVQTTQADPESLALSDYSLVGTPIAGNEDFGDLTAAQYNSITFGAAYYGWISKTGWTKLGLREGHDREDSEPGTTGLNKLTIYTSDNADSHPYLDVSYTEGPTIMITNYNLRFYH